MREACERHARGMREVGRACPTSRRALLRDSPLSQSSAERRGNNLKGSKGLLPENEGQSLALTVLHAASSLDIGDQWWSVSLLTACRALSS